MVHRPLVTVMKLMLSVFSNTSHIERSYSFLEMICEQHRKRMLDSTMNTLHAESSKQLAKILWEDTKKIPDQKRRISKKAQNPSEVP